MKNSRDGKSYSTNLAFTPPEYLRTGCKMICVRAKPNESNVSDRTGKEKGGQDIKSPLNLSSIDLYINVKLIFVVQASDVFCRGALAEGWPTCCRWETWQTMPWWNRLRIEK